MKLTRDEIYLLVFILGALVVGAFVKQCRDARRVAPLIEAPKAMETVK